VDPRRALGVGIGILVFAGPLVALYLYMRADMERLVEAPLTGPGVKSGRFQPPCDLPGVKSGRLQPPCDLPGVKSGRPESRSERPGAQAAAQGHAASAVHGAGLTSADGDGCGRRVPVSIPPVSSSAGVAVLARRTGPGLFEVVFLNGTAELITLAVPTDLGRAVRIVPVSSSPGRLPWPAFDPRRDVLVPLPPGASMAMPYAGPREAVPGPVKVVYDCTGGGVPDGAWRGRIESAPVE
jgi:hypothetical protein